MSDYKDLHSFVGGLDYDSESRNVADTDYIDGMCIASGTNKIGGIRNMLGNTLIPYTLPIGNNTCIGSHRNIKENSIIYFVYNDSNNHSILEYYCDTRTILPILEPSSSLGFTTEFLGFTLENKIHSSNIIDNILTWTDNNVSPKQINKKSARAYLNSTPPDTDTFPYDSLIATGTDAQKTQFIEFIKYKPERQPTIVLKFDSTRKTNYLQEKMIQVCYRYIYVDNEISRWSDGSWVSLPYGTENINGTFANSIANNNLEVFIDTGHPNVVSIDVAFRFGNTGVWGKLDSPIRKYDNDNQRILADYTIYVYSFYNDTVLIEVPFQVDNYDAVPQISKTQDVIDNNIQVFGNNVEGYQNPKLEVTTEYQNTLFDMGLSSLYAGDKTPTTNMFTIAPIVLAVPPFIENNPSIAPYRQAIIIPQNSELVQVGTVITFDLQRSDDANFSVPPGTYNPTFTISYGVTSDDLVNWPINFRNSLYEAIRTTAYPLYLAQGFQFYDGILISWIITQDDPFITPEYTRIENFNVIPPTVKQPSLKKGAFHTYGIVYRDIQGRDGGVVTGQDMVLYNPYLPEIIPQTDLDNQYAYLSHAKFTINNLPPSWAYTYEIVYSLSNIRKYTQFLLKGVTPDIKNGNYVLNCQYIIDYITKDRITTSVDFQFEVGDYLRFICNTDKYVQTYVNAKVLAFDTTTNKLTVSPYSTSQITAGMTSATQEGTLCELYSLRTQLALDNRPYFSIGETYNIINHGTANAYHSGNIQNQNSTTPAIVSLTHGDCYIYRRYFNNNTLESMVESENFSDIYASKNIDISMVYTVIPEGKTRRYEQGLRYGGRYFPNTNTNNLCQFNGSDFDTLNTRYGPINKIISIGYTLKVLQTKKNTSIYIDRNMIFNADGNNQLTLTDRVLGNKNPSELDYGCEHPESVFIGDRQMYFFDVNTGTFIQDSANGMYPISDNKAKTYFRNISKQIKNQASIYVYGYMDIFNGYVNVSFVDVGIVPIIENQTIVYNISDNRWKSKMPYIPDYFGGNAIVFVSFKDGEIWLHNDNQTRNNFYGVQYSTSIKFVSNIDYPKVKVFDAIAINTNKVFSSPNQGDISIPAALNYPDGMESRLIASKFRSKEGVSYAQYLRDMTTPNSISAQDALLSGRKLRGEALIQQIENSDIDEVVLYSVIVHSTPSELSK